MIELSDLAAADVRQQHRHHDRNHGVDDDENGVVKQGVPGDLQGVRGREQVLKVLEADPVAAEQALPEVYVLKGDHQPRHGEVVINQQVGQSRQGHQVQQAVFPEV